MRTRNLLPTSVALLTAVLLAGCDAGSVSSPSLEEVRTPVVSSVVGATCAGCVFGPQTYVREKGSPVTELAVFAAAPSGSYVIDIDDLGTEGADGSVELNGQVLMAPRIEGEVGPRHITQAVSLAAQNSLIVRLTGMPGSQLMVSIQTAGFVGNWQGFIGAAPLSIDIWEVAGVLAAAADFGVWGRELLQVAGGSSGSPETLTLYRGSDAAAIRFERNASGQVSAEYFEEGACSRSIQPLTFSASPSSTSPGSSFGNPSQSAYVGVWSGQVAGSAFTVDIQQPGGQTVVTGDFGLGAEALVTLGFSQAQALLLYRPSDQATIAIYGASAGLATLDYWKSGCPQTVSVTQVVP